MKRFYKEAGVGEVGTAGGPYTVLLDGRPVRTPGRALLTLPRRPLADAVATEWARQDQQIRPATMPLMSLACTATDLVVPGRAAVIDEVATFGETDLVCYRAELPEALVERQQESWQPLVDWTLLAFDVSLNVTRGVLPRPQSEASLKALRAAVEAHDDFALSALATAVKVAGSLIIGLALSHRRLDPEEAFQAAELDALFQIGRWGEDAEAARRLEGVRAELRSAARFLALLRA